MMRVSSEVTALQRSQFADLTERQARKVARQRLEQLGADMVEAVNDIIDAEYEQRDGDRHKEDSHPLHDDSFEYRVFTAADGGFPMRVELRNTPWADVKKIAALNFGARKRYVIRPNPPKKKLHWEDVSPTGSTDNVFAAEVVRFPYNSAKEGRFMQRARERAVRRMRARR